MAITFKHTGNFKSTETLFKKAQRMVVLPILHKYGSAGVSALANATPVNTGLTANSWTYEIIADRRGYRIEWHNTNKNAGVIIAVILQYGHGTGTGGWIPGRDYINPAIRPIFDRFVSDILKEVSNL